MEQKNLDDVKELLREVESTFDDRCSVAAQVARVWAGLLDDTWVWGGESICLSPFHP